MPFYRDEQEAQRLPTLRRVASQHVEEGYCLVGPAGLLTPVIEHVYWMDSHAAGPDTHVAVCFGGNDALEFPFDVALAMVWHADAPRVSHDELVSAAPVRWGQVPTPA